MTDVDWLVALVMNRLLTFARSLCTVLSEWLELCLVNLSLPLQILFEVISSSKGDGSGSSTERAWWDPSKGTAIVVHASGADQSIARSIALRLASEPVRKTRWPSWLVSPHRSGCPPYTCIVLLDSAEEVVPLVNAWAQRKATLDLSRRPPPDVDPLDAAESETDSDREASTSHRSARSPHPVSDPTRRKRSLSIGSWTAPDVWSTGRDMWKGLRIGVAEADRKSIGSLIPIVVDLSTAEGLSNARTTISHYCSSHHLLLRALVIIPSLYGATIRCEPEVHHEDLGPSKIYLSGRHPQTEEREDFLKARGRKSEKHLVVTSGHGQARERSSASVASPPLSPRSFARHEVLHRRIAELGIAVERDLLSILRQIDTLLPALRRDKGRLIGLVPSGWGGLVFPSEPKCGRQWKNDTEAQDTSRTACSQHRSRTSPVTYSILREAMKTLWEYLAHDLESAGIDVCRVEVCADDTPAPWGTVPSQKVKEPQRIFREPALTQKQIAEAISETSPPRRTLIKNCIITTLCTVHFALNPPLDILVDNATYATAGGGQISPYYPQSLLYTTILRAIVRTHPRSWEPVGLGPRIESALEEVPGARWMRRQLGKWLREDDFEKSHLERVRSP